MEFQSETFDARTAKFGKGKSKIIDSCLENVHRLINDGGKPQSVDQKQQRKALSQIKFQKAKKTCSKNAIKKIMKHPRNAPGTSGATNIGVNSNDTAWIQSVISSKQTSAQRKSKHSR